MRTVVDGALTVIALSLAAWAAFVPSREWPDWLWATVLLALLFPPSISLFLSLFHISPRILRLHDDGSISVHWMTTGGTVRTSRSPRSIRAIEQDGTVSLVTVDLGPTKTVRFSRSEVVGFDRFVREAERLGCLTVVRSEQPPVGPGHITPRSI